jgi:hypothetical protein
VHAISNASIIIDGFAGSLEERWTIYDSKISPNKVAVDALETNEDNLQGEQVDGRQTGVDQDDTEDLDDHESLDQIEMTRSSIYRFLQKLSRYYVACRIITSELVALVRSGAEPNITVETVPISMTTSTPADENEYPSFESYFEQCVRADVKSLDPKKVDRLLDKWPRDRESQNLFLHAEMQIALFYALNPLLCSIQGFIGVSKKCCWCCDFVLESVISLVSWISVRLCVYEYPRHLQIPSEQDGKYNADVAPPFSSRFKELISASTRLGYSLIHPCTPCAIWLTTPPSSEFAADLNSYVKTWRMPFVAR